MSRRVLPCSVLVLLGVLALAWCAPDPRSEDSLVAKERKQVRTLRHKLHEPLKQEVSFDASTPLKEALGFLSDLCDVDMQIDDAAFKCADPAADVSSLPVRLAKMNKPRLQTVLRLLMEQVPAGTYRVHPDHIEITTIQRAWPAGWAAMPRNLVPRADVDVEKRSLEAALKDLAEDSGFNIVIDARIGEKAKTPVTARMRDVPIDTAVHLLANMAGLVAVTRDNVLYVTTNENMEALEQVFPQQNPAPASPPAA